METLRMCFLALVANKSAPWNSDNILLRYPHKNFSRLRTPRFLLTASIAVLNIELMCLRTFFNLLRAMLIAPSASIIHCNVSDHSYDPFDYRFPRAYAEYGNHLLLIPYQCPGRLYAIPRTGPSPPTPLKGPVCRNATMITIKRFDNFVYCFLARKQEAHWLSGRLQRHGFHTQQSDLVTEYSPAAMAKAAASRTMHYVTRDLLLQDPKPAPLSTVQRPSISFADLPLFAKVQAAAALQPLPTQSLFALPPELSLRQ